MKYYFNISILFAVGVFFLFSCDPNRVYEKNIAIDNGVWNKDSVVSFVMDIEDTLQPYNFYINIRNSTDYRYSNLYLFIDTYFPDETHARDTLEFILAGTDGKWFGKGFGKIKESTVLLRRGVRFPMSGKYRFTMEQAMRTENLEGIEDVGMRIEKTEE
jgi:gliding motility-associated lipoprotein GldH